MRHSFTALLFSLCIAMTGCTKEDASTPSADTSDKKATATQPGQAKDPKTAIAKPMPFKNQMGVLTPEDKKRLENTVASSFGKGSFEDKTGTNYSFTMEGSILSDKSGYGRFRFYSFNDNGKMDVNGEMTCVNIDSAERRIWLAGRITENTSTDKNYRGGAYAPGNYVQFRARPNSMDGKNPAAIETPDFVSESSAKAFCSKQEWAADALNELGENDLIAAIP